MDEGFTILEALVALMVLSLSITLSLRVISSSLTLEDKLTSSSDHLFLAENYIQQVGISIPLKVGRHIFNDDSISPQIVEILIRTDEAPEPGRIQLYKINTIIRDGLKGSEQYNIETFRLGRSQ